MPKTVIRSAERVETPEIADLIGAALTPFLSVGRPPIERYIAYSRNIAGRWNAGDLLVIEDAEGIAGTVTYVDRWRRQDRLLPAGWATFRTLAVHPRVRGRGLGKRLVDHCIAAAREDGSEVIGLHTGAFMATARGLYHRAGFVRSPEYDFFASSFLAFDTSEGDLLVAASRLDLPPAQPLSHGR
ncbi:GNAT family N-acetyltransferase [Mesorhizobium sp. IMUNJ 23232]|uniref:GNAT family N-acetyltransferase n=1 Tax=Mesorhizobium sp. IMUNJ 23232 TaxID=3376064 RepID=UPI0037A12D21